MATRRRARDAGGTPKSAGADAGSHVGASLPVVGIGASAGGLKAISQLLEHMPGDTGMALVVVQHLDPVRESMLVELLARASALPVSEVSDGVALEPDHVYVIPPNADLLIEHDCLRLRARDPAQRPPMPIDGFFRSLAERIGRRAIGVVLSGTASDGALGLAAIKVEGGITFAQSPESAEYDGMPRAAIAANAVDFVLAPREIAAELGRIAHHPYVAHQSDLVAAPPLAPNAEEDLFQQIYNRLRRAFGVDFTDYKFGTIGRRVARRMVLHRIDRLEDYLTVLADDPMELEALYHDVLIMVTEFFREPESYAALRTQVYPHLLEGRSPGEEVRVWVPGCASGEEAYSLAMALSDYLASEGDGRPLKVFATDVNEREIERARAGRYAETIASSLPPDYLARYFSPVDGGYRVIEPIRQQCIFARHDVTRDVPFSRLDLVSCRNLLIYLGAALQKRVIPALHYALRPGGHLILGASESVGGYGALFEVVDKKQRIYRARARSATLSADLWPLELPGGSPAWQPVAAAAPGPAQAAFDIDRAADAIVLSSFSPPGVVVNDALEIIQFRGETEPYLRHFRGRATLHLLDMAREDLAMPLSAALSDARRTRDPVSQGDVVIRRDGRALRLRIHVVPVPAPGEKLYFIILFEREQQAPGRGGAKPTATSGGTKAESLRRELATTRDYLQTVIQDREAGNEELRAAYEEIQSSNEELQSINEELETAKEELQSSNEELRTVNDELNSRNVELSAITDDLSNLLASVDIPLIIVGRDLRVRRLTPGAERALRLSAGSVDRPLADLALPFDLPDLEELVEAVIAELAPTQRDVQDREGRWYSLQVRPYKTAENTIAGAVLALLDIDDLKRSLDEIRETALMSEALAGIHATISSTLDPDEILGRVVLMGAEALHAESASLVAREEGAWVTRYAHGHIDGVIGAEFSDAGLPHVALAAGTRAPVAIAQAGDDERISLAAVKLMQLRSVLAVPLLTKDAVTGVLLFNWHERGVAFSAAQLDFAAKLAASVSLALDNARLFAAERENARLATGLNAVGVAVSAARSPEAIVEILAREGLAMMGCEGALAVLLEGDEFVTRVALGAAAPLLGQRFGRDENPIVGQPQLSRQPFVANDAAHDPRLPPGFADRFGVQSLLFAPLLTNQEMIGVVAFANLTHKTPFSEEHARLVEALATTGALAIEKARSFDIEHRTAEAFRRLLALPVPTLPTLRIGSAHSVAATAERVGGDFFDIFAIDERMVALFIADVSGKGVRAAGYAETIRSAVRTLTYLDSSPAFVLEGVNASLLRQGDGELFATAALYVIDVESGDVRFSSAGHPPALLCAAGCEAVPTEAGVPLGSFPRSYIEQSLRLESGEVLLAYTDGVTEARRGKSFFGEVRLLKHFAKAKSRDPQELVDGLIAAASEFSGGQLSDDIAVIAVSLAP